MATEHRWQGATGNWQLASNWDTGEIPSVHDSTDNAIFSGLSQQSVDSGVDLSIEFRLKRIITQATYRGNIGVTGDPLHASLASTVDVRSRIIHRGTGQFHFKGVVGDFADVLVDSVNSTNAFFAEGTIRNLFVKNGYVRVLTTGNLANYVVVNGPGARLVIDASASSTAPDFIVMTAGICENKRITLSTTTIVIMGGHLIQTGAILDGAQIFIGPHGRMTYQPNITLTSAHDDVDVATFGLLDLSQSHQDITFDNYIIGIEGAVNGTPVQSGVVGPLSTNIDLREEYP